MKKDYYNYLTASDADKAWGIYIALQVLPKTHQTRHTLFFDILRDITLPGKMEEP